MSNLNNYYDNAATSFPKPKEVADAVFDYINHCGGTYGRSAYRRVVDATMCVEECRDSIAKLLNAESEKVFFSQNATHSANLIIQGLSTEIVNIAVSPLEHNAIMRPLEHLYKLNGVKYCVLPHISDGRIDTEKLDSFFLKNRTDLVVINHQSNVNGVVQPLEEICKIAKNRGVKIMIDVTQSIGSMNIDVRLLDVDYLIFTGHKNLNGIMGVGGAYIKEYKTIRPLIYGGTGSKSDSYDMPQSVPDIFEAGTPNIPAIVGLNAAINAVKVLNHTKNDFLDFILELRKNRNIKLFTSNDLSCQGEVISIIHNKLTVSEFSDTLYNNFKIELRSGLHCSPLAHKTLNTFPSGTVRISPSCFHSVKDFEYLLNSIYSVK